MKFKSAFSTTTAVLLSLFLAAAACKKTEEGGLKKPAIENIARVTFLSGEAFAIRKTGEIALKLGDFIHPDDAIRTGDSSTVELFIRSQGIIRISDKTMVEVQSLLDGGKYSVNVKSGTAAFFLKKNDRTQEFDVNLPTAVASVRGTTFLVEAKDANESRVALFDGAVELKNEKASTFVLDRKGEVVLKKGMDLRHATILPLSNRSLGLMKRLAVFQRNNILEYNTLMDELKNSSVARLLEISDAAKGDYASLRDETKRPDEYSGKAAGAEEQMIKRDTHQDPLKLKTEKSYKK